MAPNGLVALTQNLPGCLFRQVSLQEMMSCSENPTEGAARNMAEQRWELRNEAHVEGFFGAACQLREQQRLVDVMVTLGLRSYNAHGALLAAVSSVFRQRLQYGDHGVVELDGVTTPYAWEAILNFAYTGELETTPELAGELLDAAEALGIPRVAEICKAILLGTEIGDRPSSSEEKWETLRSLEELYKDGIGWDLVLEAEGHTYQGEQAELTGSQEHE